ncbi:MAG: hypothetical protein LBB50_02155, partial [Oscillospiraceae bacterium]|nr:hypothetical protein [Oscillospiraceae bacterium]
MRRQYRTNLRHRAGPNEIYCEWLRDNYYLVEREGGAVLRELRQGGDAHALQAALALCRASLCPQGSLAEPALFAQALARAKVTSAVSEALPLALRFALVNEAVASAAEKDKEQRVRQLRGAVTALRALPELDLPGILEETDPLEACLRRDPAGVYPRMEEGSRAALRHLLRRAARRAHQSDEGYAGAQMEICAGVPEGSAARHIGTGLMQQALHPGRGAALLWGETLLPVVFSVLAATLCHALILLPLLVL